MLSSHRWALVTAAAPPGERGSSPAPRALPPRQRFCVALGAPVVARDGGDPRALGGVAEASGAAWCAARLRDDHAITSRDELIAWTRGLLHAGGERALDLARVAAACGYAAWAGVMTEDDAWHVLLLTGALAQRAYGSWDAFAGGYERAWRASGGAPEPTATILAELRAGAWSELPWDTELEVTLLDPARPRILRGACARCGAPIARPSATAFVYCAWCGELVDYDFARACARPHALPGPLYEALRAELATPIAEARDAGDRERHRALHARLLDAWALACPDAAPLRARDPAYRARYVAWLAEAETLAAFDPEARARQAAVDDATARLAFVETPAGARVLPGPFRALCDAVLASEAVRDELFAAHGLADRHPDGAPRELARRISRSLFVQGWLPYLDEAEARALIERAGVSRDYAVLDAAPPTRAIACATCGGPLEVLEGARRVVCEHCGRHVAVIGAPATDRSGR